MKKLVPILFTLVLFFLIIGCNNEEEAVGNPDVNEPETDTEIAIATVTYKKDESDFPNPDRGFYRPTITRASNYNALKEQAIRRDRNPQLPSTGDYECIRTLIFRYLVLDDFKNTPISQDFLDNLQQDFTTIRDAGAKMIIRFSYVNTTNSDGCASTICPPYGDASKEIVLGHIQQLSSLISDNIDVVHALQMGFIGIWGEQYYTDFFGDPSTQGKILDENWKDRADILKALLDATPKELMIQVRYPQLKQRYVYGVESGTDAAALTLEEAFSESDKARIGFHNDCLFASDDDLGTYYDYGNSNSQSRKDIINLKSYFAEDSKYVVVGGETCRDSYNPQSDCAPSGIADVDLRKLHYTYLNSEYNNDVNNDWISGGCIEDIKKNLGYRLTLGKGEFPEKAIAGKDFKISLSITNSGYSAPMNERNVFLVLQHQNTGSIIKLPFETDVRTWQDEVSLSHTFRLPADAKGDYKLQIHFADVHEKLKDRPEYSIRLANKDMWQENTGYNDLNYTLSVEQPD